MNTMTFAEGLVRQGREERRSRCSSIDDDKRRFQPSLINQVQRKGKQMAITRRHFFASLPLPLLLRFAPTSARFKLAICNEIFEGWSFERMCRGAVEAGYDGLEIAPFTLSEDPVRLSKKRRSEVRKTMESEGLVSTGLHWLLRAPGGMHITTPDRSLRRKSWEHLRGLIDLAADLGDGAVMVLGSGRQRGTVDGTTVEEAKARLSEGLAGLAPAAEAAGVTILMEPLAPHLCDVVNTLEEALEIVRAVGSPGVQTLFDVHNAAAEPLPHDQTIKKYFESIRYVQINEMDGGYPGSGDYDFKAMLKAFRDLSYEGWISVEVFDLSPGPETIARQSAALIRKLESEL